MCWGLGVEEELVQPPVEPQSPGSPRLLLALAFQLSRAGLPWRAHRTYWSKAQGN